MGVVIAMVGLIVWLALGFAAWVLTFWMDGESPTGFKVAMAFIAGPPLVAFALCFILGSTAYDSLSAAKRKRQQPENQNAN